MTVGLKGHVMGVAFPEGYSNWQETDLHELIDAELVPEPTDKNVVKAVRKLAKEADSIVIATDFDREGELIGLEALQQVLDVNPSVAEAEIRDRPPVARARYSALTKEEIERAFSEPRPALLRPRLRRLRAPGHRPDLGRDADPRGLARQPPLRLQLPLRRPGPEPDAGADRRARARAPRPRAEAVLGAVRELRPPRRHRSRPTTPPTSSGRRPRPTPRSRAPRARAWSRRSARAATRASRRPRSTPPPSPPTPPAGSGSRRPPRCGSPRTSTWTASSPIPRTDNTVYPASLNTTELVTSLVRIPEFEAAKGLLDKPLQATRGKKETTDHPPIYPTQAVYPGALEGPKRRVYELVVRRFLATFCAADDHRVDPRRHRGRLGDLLRPRLGRRRPRLRRASTPTPAPPTRRSRRSSEGQSLDLDGDPWIVDKETQPPSRISQGKLIELMEERGLGTKATRADIIQKLYDRGYVFSNPPEPSETGIAMYKAFHDYVPRMATPGDDRRARARHGQDRRRRDLQGRGRSDQPRDAARDDHRARGRRSEDLAKQIWAGMDEDKFLGPCKVCEEAGRKRENGEPNRLRIIDLKGGKRMYGCEGWNRDDPESPDSCRVSGPLPGTLLRALAARGALLGLRRAPAADGEEARPRAAVEALPQRRLPDDGRDAREARRARGRERGPQGRQGGRGGERRDGRPRSPAPPAKGGGRRRPKKPAPTTARTKRARSKT